MVLLYFSPNIFITFTFLGNISCHTVGGRVATIIYASTGIPIFLFALNALGKALFSSVQHIWETFRAYEQVLRFLK